MKKTTLIVFFASLLAVAANAQDASKSSYPSWTISKDVKRMEYKNSIYTPAVVSTSDAVPISKGVQQLQANNTPRRKGMITTNGYPAWTISKGTARLQAAKNSK